MGTCLMCHRKVRNGQRYCDSCKQKRKNRADESYLDSLLNSVGVKEAAPAVKEVPEVRNTAYSEKTESFDYNRTESLDNNFRTEALDSNNNRTESLEMDSMLSDILDDIDATEPYEQSAESDIQLDDIEGIFDEAEAYATLLNKDGTDYSTAKTVSDPAYDINPENNVTVAMTDVNGQGQDNFVDIDWKNDYDPVPGDNIDALFEEVDSQVTENLNNYPYSEYQDLSNIDKTIQGENTDQINFTQAFSDFDPIDESISIAPKPKKKKLSWFKRLFGNTNDDVTPEMLEAEKIRKAEEEEQARIEKEEKKRIAEEKKAEAEAEKARKKEEADAERNRKMAIEAEKKAAAKEKERKKKETALAIAEYEMEHGKINKAGATILFVIFAILTVVIIIGTNIYSYNLSFKNAREDFEVKKYNEAYYEVYGYEKDDVREEDLMLYDRIMTVMYVNTQLNSYEYYMTSNNREKAMDSLLKGLHKYEKYFMLAQKLEITDDLDYVKDKILDKLESEFGINEIQAYSMIAIEEPIDYSEYLYGIIDSYEDDLEKYN